MLRILLALLATVAIAALGEAQPRIAPEDSTIKSAAVLERGLRQETIHLDADQLELFVDRYLIQRMDGVELRLHRPVDRGSVMTYDAPWEGSYVAYVTVMKDGPLYRMYYRGKPAHTPTGADDETTCYAESRDGIRWTKPELGLFEVNGTRKNNVILDSSFSPLPSNFSPFIDTRPGIPAGEKFKALAGRFDGRVGNTEASTARPAGGVQQIVSSGGLLALVSADGIHWKKISDQPVISKENYPYASDCPIEPTFWSESENCYVTFIRTRTSMTEVARARAEPGRRVAAVSSGEMRWIGRATSPDFVHWSKVEMMDYASPPTEQLYTNTTSPYFRAPQLYIGVAARIVFDRRVITPEQAAQIKVDPLYVNDSAEPVFLTSRGGVNYDRTFLEPLIRNNLGAEDWTSRNNYPAMNLIPTGPMEMSLYVQKSYGQPSHHLERYTFVTDRLASVNAPFGGGEFVTKPLLLSGRNLLINFSTSVAGGIWVELQNAAGEPMPGHALADATETVGNDIERAVAWKNGSDLSRFNGIPVRLRFVMKEADLFAIRFR